MALTSRELRDAYNNGECNFDILFSQIDEALRQENLSNTQKKEIEQLKEEINTKQPIEYKKYMLKELNNKLNQLSGNITDADLKDQIETFKNNIASLSSDHDYNTFLSDLNTAAQNSDNSDFKNAVETLKNITETTKEITPPTTEENTFAGDEIIFDNPSQATQTDEKDNSTKELRTRNILEKFGQETPPQLSAEDAEFLMERIVKGKVSDQFTKKYGNQIADVIKQQLAGQTIEQIVAKKINIVETVFYTSPDGQFAGASTKDYGIEAAVESYKKTNAKNLEKTQDIKWKKDIADKHAELIKNAEKLIAHGGTDEELKNIINQLNGSYAPSGKWFKSAEEKALADVYQRLNPVAYRERRERWMHRRADFDKKEQDKAVKEHKHAKEKQKEYQDKTKRMETRMQAGLNLWQKDAETPWSWNNIGEKLENKWRKFKMTINRRHPERLAKRLAKRKNTSEIKTGNAQLQSQITSLQSKIDSGLLSPRHEKAIKSQIELCQRMISNNEAHITKIETKLNERLSKIEASLNKKSTKLDSKMPKEKPNKKMNKLRSSLEARAATLQSQFQTSLEDNVYYQVLQKLSAENKSGISDGTNFKVNEQFSSEAVLEAALKERGYSDDKIAEIKATVFPKTTEEEKNKGADADKVIEDDKVVEEDLSKIKTKAKIQTVENIAQGENVGTSGFTKTADNEYQFLNKANDGTPISPKKEQITELLTSLKASGIKNIEITDFDADTTQLFINALESEQFKGAFEIDMEALKKEQETRKKQEEKQEQKEETPPTNEEEKKEEKKEEKIESLDALKESIQKSTQNDEAQKEKLFTINAIEHGAKYTEEEINKIFPETDGKQSVEAQYLLSVMQGHNNNNNNNNNSNSNNDNIDLTKVTNYIEGLSNNGRETLTKQGKKPIKFKELSKSEQKLARQIHSRRMNVIKEGKKKNLNPEEIKKKTQKTTLDFLNGYISARNDNKNNKSTNKQIKNLANANAAQAIYNYKSGNVNN